MLVDGINAVKNATLEGILPGGGAALVHASKLIDYVEVSNWDEQMGLKVLQQALREPFLNILQNAGYAGQNEMECLLKTNDWRIGFDVRKGEVVDVMKEGVGSKDSGYLALFEKCSHRC